MTEAEDRAVKALIIERDELKDHCRRLQSVVDAVGYAPGHYYSPIVDINDGHVIRAVQERLRSGFPAGVAVNPEAMKEMLMRLAGHHSMFFSLAIPDRRIDFTCQIHFLAAMMRASTFPYSWNFVQDELSK